MVFEFLKDFLFLTIPNCPGAQTCKTELPALWALHLAVRCELSTCLPCRGNGSVQVQDETELGKGGEKENPPTPPAQQSSHLTKHLAGRREYSDYKVIFKGK